MKKTLFTGFLTVFYVAIAAPAPGVTFRELNDRVLAQSVDLQRAKLAESIAENQADIVSRNWYPKLSAQALYAIQTPKPAVPKDQTYSLTLSHTFYDFGRARSHEKLAEAQIKMKSLSTEAVREGLYWETAHRYQDLISALRIASAAEQAVKIAQERFETQQRYYRQGMRSESDLASAEADFRREQLVQARAEDDVLFASIRIQSLSTAPGESSVVSRVPLQVPTLSLASLSAQRANELLGKWNEVKTSATQKRFAAELETFDLQKQAAAAECWPVIGGAVSGQESGSWSELKPSANAQLQLSWAIPWSGAVGLEQQKLVLAEKDLELQKQNDEKLRRDRESLATSQIERLVAQLQLLRDRAKTLERVQELVRRRYEAGRSSALELTAATADLSNARLEEVRQTNSLQNALIDVAEARSHLDIHALFFQ